MLNDVRPPRCRTLVFCTAHVDDVTVWDGRYRRWFDALTSSGLHCTTALMVDDGSGSLPEWPDVTIVREGESLVSDAARVLFHFEHNLGRASVFDFPGWYRSFTFACEYADRNRFDKVVHIESDAFIVSKRLRDYIDDVDDGWIALWCAMHDFPEITLQVMAGSGLSAYRTFCASVPHEALVGHAYETQIPFTRIERGFVGDRYGERLPYVPVEADYVSQAPEADRSYYWWMAPTADGSQAPPTASSRSDRTRRLDRDNEILRYDRGRLQTTIYALQNELDALQRENRELRITLAARPSTRLLRLARLFRVRILGNNPRPRP